MPRTPLPCHIQARLPDLAVKLAAILGPLAAAVAAGFLRRPALVGLIPALWRRLTHVARRFAAVRGAAAPGKAEGVRQRPMRAMAVVALVRLPTRRGWLVEALGYQAAGYASQLAHLLAQPEMRAVLDAAPGFGRVLRPICWMLGIARQQATSAVELAAVTAGGTARRLDPPWPPAPKPAPPPAPWEVPVLQMQHWG